MSWRAGHNSAKDICVHGHAFSTSQEYYIFKLSNFSQILMWTKTLMHLTSNMGLMIYFILIE
jgi:hypothetical protein